MLGVQVAKLETQWLIRPGFLRFAARLRCALCARCFGLLRFLLRIRRFWLRRFVEREVEPIRNADGRFSDADILHQTDEIEDVATSFAFPETVPTVFRNADPELSRVFSLVNRARPAEAVVLALEALGK